jgi:hypothetical protein
LLDAQENEKGWLEVEQREREYHEELQKRKVRLPGERAIW